MPSTKTGQKEVRIVLEETSETYLTLKEWAQKRGLTAGKGLRVIATDWSDAMNGRPNPFAAAIAAAGGNTQALSQITQPIMAVTPEVSPEDKARQDALLQAAAQFL